MENIVNNSGQGKNIIVPDVISKKFNWGACILSFIWGMFNNVPITFIIIPCFIIPVFGQFACLILSLWFGIKGNEWAWQNKTYYSAEEFHKIQRNWAILGILAEIIITIWLTQKMIKAVEEIVGIPLI